MNKNVIIRYTNNFKELLFENNLTECEVRNIIEKYCSDVKSQSVNGAWNFTIPFISLHGKSFSIHGDINFHDFIFYVDVKLLGTLIARKEL